MPFLISGRPRRPGFNVRRSLRFLKRTLCTDNTSKGTTRYTGERNIMRFEIVPIALATLCFGMVLAQEPNAAGAKQQKLGALKQSMAKNQAELKQYAWTESTQ